MHRVSGPSSWRNRPGDAYLAVENRASSRNEAQFSRLRPSCLDAFASSNGEGSGLVGPRDAPRALGAVAANALGGPKGFIPELGIPNASIPNDEKHLASDSEDVKSMMRERR